MSSLAYDSSQCSSLADACSGSAFVVFMSLLNAWVGSDEKICRSSERVTPIETPDEEYDFIVVGSGAGGSVVAGRLSEISKAKILLLEAGGDEPPGAEIPAMTFAYLGTKDIWDFKTTGEANACQSTNGSCAWPSGKVLGGNTAHNAMIYLRGLPKDYNDWADQGNEGWTWEEVEPFFIMSEDNGEIERVGTEHHGTGGPLSVERFSYRPALVESILGASEELGLGVSEDLNGDERSGFSVIQATVKDGVRFSAARAFLRPNRHRKNLHVSLNSHVTKVLIEDGAAVGVEYFKNGEFRTARATKEVIVSGGAVKSPHMLLLSGIGPKEQLESFGIDVVLDLPGVGENLRDHPTFPIGHYVNVPDTYDNNWEAAIQYMKNQTGPMSGIGSIACLGIIPTDETMVDFPDVEIYFRGYVAGCAPGGVDELASDGQRVVEILPSILRPKSQGKITLASADPFDNPNIWANYLGEPEDVQTALGGVKRMLELTSTDALKQHGFTLVDQPLDACAQNEFMSDDYWICVLKYKQFFTYHQAGTCKMGPASDPMAVVDARLRVHGIKGLRVADTSIMPQVTSSNTQAPTMMIGERAAAFIKEDYNM